MSNQTPLRFQVVAEGTVVEDCILNFLLDARFFVMAVIINETIG